MKKEKKYIKKINMLNPTEIKSIVASGEGYNAEFKVSLPSKIKEITEEVCAFANASGGVVLIGVDDANNIKGITIDNAKRSAIQNSINEISPVLKCDFNIIILNSLSIMNIFFKSSIIYIVINCLNTNT